MALDHKALLLNLMGLPENTDDAALTNSISAFQSDMVAYKEATDSDLVRLENSVRQATQTNEQLTAANEKLTNSNTQMLEVLINADVASFKDVISDEAGVKAMLMNNREVGLKFLNSLKLTNAAAPAPVIVADPKPTRKAPLHNSSKAAQPEPILNANQGETEEFSVKVSNRAREIQSTNKGMGWNQAFLNARAELVAGQQIVN
jgi:hypothetical protein